MNKLEKHAFLLHLALLSSSACASHTSGETGSRSDSDMLARVVPEIAAAMMSDEERQAAEDRAKVRELQRKQGLRVCEEGEHGTTWREDCKTCTCDHGRRSCPPVVCTTKSGRQGKHPREL